MQFAFFFFFLLSFPVFFAEKRLLFAFCYQRPPCFGCVFKVYFTADPNPQFLGELISAELSSASESIQPGLINLGRSKFEFDSAHVKYGV